MSGGGSQLLLLLLLEVEELLQSGHVQLLEDGHDLSVGAHAAAAAVVASTSRSWVSRPMVRSIVSRSLCPRGDSTRISWVPMIPSMPSIATMAPLASPPGKI